MRLMISHKHCDTSVQLFFRTRAEAEGARDRASRERSDVDKRMRRYTFGPDMMGQSFRIHEDCLGSVLVAVGDAEDCGFVQIGGEWKLAVAAQRIMAQKKAEEAARKADKRIIEVPGVLAPTPGDGKGA